MSNNIYTKIFITVLIFFHLYSCKNSNSNFLAKTINDLNIEKNKYKTFVFIALDPECPLSQSYTKKINDIIDKYNDKAFFVNFIPGNNYTIERVNLFINKYNLNGKIYIDQKLKLTKIFDAAVVPESFVLNEDYELVYKGLIDDWVGEIGRTKQYTKKNYLIDAIESSINGDLPKINSTVAIGCLIER